MDIHAIFYWVVAGILGLFYIRWKLKVDFDKNTIRPSNEYLPQQEKQNDKLVIVDQITRNDIDSIMKGFCNMYNKESFKAQPRVYALTDTQFAITFPFDIDFVTYCFFVNYVHYPMGFKKSFDVTGWTTTRSGETWVTEKTENKKVMLFIPQDDTDYDNVYLTTFDNIGYKLGFASGQEKQLLDYPKKQFDAPKIDFEKLKNIEFTDFK